MQFLLNSHLGKVLYSKNPHEKLRPASVTKIMTILLIMEALDRGEINISTSIPCSEKAASMGGSQIWLDSRESLTVDEMLKAICVVSANDCTVAMAEYLAGSEELFVQKMNEKAKELGMNDTTFKNCHGIDEEDHLTSSYDIALMSRELLIKYPNIVKYTTIWMDTLREGKSQLVNTNKLVRTYDGITGLKTGSTSLALYNLSATATRNDLSLIAVIMRAPTPQIRFSEAKLLLDYGFTTYNYKKIAYKNDVFQNVSVEKGVTNNINLLYENDVGLIINKNQNENITQEVNIDDNIVAPINKGQILGKIDYYLDSSIITSVNLIAENNISKINIVNSFTYLIRNWISF